MSRLRRGSGVIGDSMEVLVECREILKLGGITDLFALSICLGRLFYFIGNCVPMKKKTLRTDRTAAE